MGSPALDIGSTKQLFIDDRVVAALANVQRQPHRPVRHGPPVLVADRPWETDGGGVYMYGGSVLFDSEERVFKMWYRASGPISRKPGAQSGEDPGGYRACYAVSEDGLEWHKPDLGASEFEGRYPQQPAAAVRRRDAVHQAPQPGEGLRRPRPGAAVQDGVHGLRGRRVGPVQGVLAGRHQVGDECRDAAPVRAGHRAERHPVRVGPAAGAVRALPPQVGPRPGRRGRQDHPAQGGGHAYREPRLRDLGRDD